MIGLGAIFTIIFYGNIGKRSNAFINLDMAGKPIFGNKPINKSAMMVIMIGTTMAMDSDIFQDLGFGPDLTKTSAMRIDNKDNPMLLINSQILFQRFISADANQIKRLTGKLASNGRPARLNWATITPTLKNGCVCIIPERDPNERSLKFSLILPRLKAHNQYASTLGMSNRLNHVKPP